MTKYTTIGCQRSFTLLLVATSLCLAGSVEAKEEITIKPVNAGVVQKHLRKAAKCKVQQTQQCQGLSDLVKLGLGAGPELLKQMKKGKTPLRLAAIAALGYIAYPPAVLPVLKLLSSDDKTVRLAAVNAAGRMESRSAVGVLSRVLGSSDLDLKIAAATALGRTRSPGAVDPLISALHHFNPRVQASAARGLGLIKDLRATMPVAELLADPKARIPARQAACVALGHLGDKSGVPMLIQAMGDPEPRVRKEAVKSIAMLKDSRAVPALSLLLRDEDIAYEVVIALGQFNDPRSLPALIRLLNERRLPSKVIQHGFWLLGEIGAPSSVLALMPFLADEDRQIAIWAADALGRIADSRASEALLHALRRKEQDVQEMAAWALEQIAGIAYGVDVESWEDWVHSPDRQKQ